MNTIDNSFLDSLDISKKPEEKKDSMGQQDFLKLMTTQLNNQDPTKPMESGEFFNQIAQFSSVAGIQELQNSFQQVASAMFSNQALQASAMVGRSVLVPANQIDHIQGENVKGAVNLSSSTTNLSVLITDDSGQLIKRINMGPHAAGEIQFNWDGTKDNGDVVPTGRYKVSSESIVDGENTAYQTFISSKVDSVSLGKQGQGITLNLSGMGQMDLADVKQVM